MSPTYRHGQILLIRRALRTVQTNDIVVVAHKGKEIIKRVALVEKDQMYLLGDNPKASTDSRSFGFLPLENAVGKVIWPRRKTST